MKSLLLKIKNNKLRSALCAVLSVIFAVCIVTAATLMPKNKTLAEAVSTVNAITDALGKAPAYPDGETVIELAKPSTGDTITFDNAVNFKEASNVRFTSAEDVKLVFNGGLTVPAETRVTFDVETKFTSGTVSVNGTMTANHRLYNTATITVGNVLDNNAEVLSEGLIVGGSLNNDAKSGGNITVSAGATLETRASTTYEANGTQSNRDGGTLMLRAKSATELGLTGSVVNNGSIVYDSTFTGTTGFSGTNVAATFKDTDSLNLNNLSAGTYVIYSSTLADVTVSLSNAVTINTAVNLLSFGKVTYKLNANNINFNIGANVSLGGGKVSGKDFTQGANELIFDGGAVWKRGDEFNYASRDYTDDLIIFIDKVFDDTEKVYINKSYIYNLDSASKSNSQNSAFFKVNNGELSVYSGTKITNYATAVGTSDGKTNKGQGGGVYIASGKILNMYGGEISRCAVTGAANAAVGAGVYNNNGTVNMYGGKVTRNAAATKYGTLDPNGYANCGSADGAGIAVVSSGTINLYGGSISYNHSALGMSDINADGGGLMLDVGNANIYGGEIRGNFAGGSGGGILAWKSTINMTGGTITQNRAAYGGGLGTTGVTTVNISGGSITDNEAFQNYYSYNSSSNYWGGEGGGICLGSKLHNTGGKLNVSGNTLISGNKAYYGGGLAVNTKRDDNSNQLTMTGGLISGNVAYENTVKAYNATFSEPATENGGGVFVYSTSATSRPMLVLSGNASIDSSNTVSFNAPYTSTGSDGNTLTAVAPIQVSGALTGSGLGALVCFSSDSISKWSNSKNANNVISFASGLNSSTYINKFVLDKKGYTLATNGSSYIKLTTVSEASDYVAQIGETATSTNQYTSLSAAVVAANDGDTIYILKSATLEGEQINVDKNITIKPVSGNGDITLVISSEAKFGAASALFNVAAGKTLTLSKGTGGERLTIDGNGTGRKTISGATPSISLVSVNSGTFKMEGNVYLRQNITTLQGSAVTVSGTGKFEMSGGVIEDNTTEYSSGNGGAVYLGDDAQFIWKSGTIQNNITTNNEANFGIYLSTEKNSLQLTGNVTLTNNIIYSGNAVISVEKDFDTVESIQLAIADVTKLKAGDTVVQISSDITDKTKIEQSFDVYNAQDGVHLGVSGNRLIVYRRVTYLLDSRAGTAEITLGSEDYANVAALITYLEADGDAASAKIRNGGLVLAIQVEYGTPLTLQALTAISDFYTRTGYTIMNWGPYAYNTTLPYQDVAIDINLSAVWQANTYKIKFDANAPKGVNVDATISGSTPGDFSEEYSQSFESGIAIPSYDTLRALGFVANGWRKEARHIGEAANLFINKEDANKNGKLSVEDLKDFKRTDTRATYELTAYVNWDRYFGTQAEYNDGIGTEESPFVIKDLQHLTNLQTTVSAGTTYASKYFQLADDIDCNVVAIGSSDNPFSGNFNGQNHTITLNGNALFGYLNNATVQNLNLAGTVNTAVGSAAGALACTAAGGTIKNIGNAASVSAAGTVGGVIGVVQNVTISEVFNTAEVTSSSGIAGGVVGNMTRGGITNAFNSGKITGVSYAGGIVGYTAAELRKTISAVYNTGSIAADTLTGVAGGIVGSLSNANLTDAFNGGTVTGKTAYAILGVSATDVGISNVYYNSDRIHAANPELSGIKALTSSKMYVVADSTKLDSMTLTGDWVYKQAPENSFYYPQLSAFAESKVKIGNTTVGALSAASVVLKVDASGEPDKPLEPKNINVTFNLDGGTIIFAADESFTFIADNTAFTQTIAFSNEAKVSKPKNEPQKIGYEFVAWFTDEACTVEYDFESGVPATDISLYAGYKAKEYRIEYERNGGTLVNAVSINTISIEKSEVTLATGETASIKNPNFKRDGYYFSHWTYITANDDKTQAITSIALIEENGEYVVVLYNGSTNQQTVKLSELTSGELRFVANWTPRTYTINYVFKILNKDNALTDVPEGLTPDKGTNRATYQIIDSFAFTPATLTGYSFKEWRDSSGNVIESISQKFGDITVTGVFEPVNYRITFNPREFGKLYFGSDETAYEITQTHKPDWLEYDSSSGLYYIVANYKGELNFNGLDSKRDGYEFSGWYLSTAGENKFTSTTFEYTRDITLFAGYTRQPVTVTVKVDSGKGYFVSTSLDSLPKSEDFKVTYTPDTDDYIYEYTISTFYGESALLYLVEPTPKTGNKFSDWGDNLSKVIKLTETVTLNAQFNQDFSVVFTNTYQGATGTVYTFTLKVPGTIESMTGFNSVSGDNPNNVKGYTFIGWRDSNGKDYGKITADKVFDAACVLFAVYEAEDIFVEFDVNDPYNESGTNKEPEAVANKNYKFNALFTGLPVSSYNGYKFIGWFTAKTGGSIVNENVAVSSLATDGASITLYAHWEEETYTVKYELGTTDAVTGMDSKVEEYEYVDTFGTAGVALPTPSRTGYTFRGWLGASIDENNKLVAGTYGDKILTAQWEIIKFTVTFSAGDGSFTVPSHAYSGTYKNGDVVVTTDTANKYEILVEYNTASPVPVNPEKLGYSFTGWPLPATITADTPVTASYVVREYNLYLSANGGTFANDRDVFEQKVKYDESLTELLNNHPTLNGYTFNSWHYSNNDPVEADIKMPANDLTLVAAWNINSYDFVIEITDNANLLTSKLTELIITYTVENNTVKFSVPYNTDLSALNGITDGNGKVLTFKVGESAYRFSLATKKQDDPAIVATWSTINNLYAITFYDNLDGKSVVHYYATGATITAPTFTRTGYKFAHWTDKDGKEVTVPPIATAELKVNEYYAHWELIPYNINYDLNGGTVTGNPTGYTVEVENIVLNVPVRDGYTFKDWYVDAAFGTAFKYERGKTTGHITLFAKWEVKTYTLTVNYKDNSSESVKSTSISVTYGEPFTQLAAFWTRPYHSVKLNFVKDGKNVEFVKPDGAALPELDTQYGDYFTVNDNGTITATVSADYTPTTYNVIYYNSDNTTLPSGSFSFSADEYALNNYNGLTPTGKTFANWGLSGTTGLRRVNQVTIDWNTGLITFKYNDGESSVNVATQDIGTISLYPMFGTTVHTVIYNANGGTGTMSTKTCEYGVVYALDENAFSREGYTFAGWASSENGKIDYYDRGAIIVTDNDVTLFAVWTPVVYTITYSGCEGVVNTNHTTYTVETPTFVLSQPTKTGYRFDGWKNNSGDAVTQITKGTIGNLTLTANWVANTYTVSFNSAGGEAVSNITVTFGSGYGKLPSPNRAGYIFDGWKYGDETIVAGSTVTVAANHLLTAQWSPEKYTVKFTTERGEIPDGKQNQEVSFSPELSNKVTYFDIESPDGYIFKGWKITGSDSVFTGDISLVEILSVSSTWTGNEITIVAVWEAETYYITYVLNGGTNADGNPETYTVESESITLKNPSRDGYTFMGWYNNAEFTGNPVTKIENGSKGSITLHAKWDIIEYKITVSAGNGQFSNGETSKTIRVNYGAEFYSQLYALQSQLVPTNSSENFLVWVYSTYNGTGDVNDYLLTSFTTNGDLEIKAIYSETLVSITLIYLSGNADTVIAQKNTVYNAPDNSTNAGYTNVVWQIFGTETTWVDKKPTESITLKEVGITAKTFELSFDNKGYELTAVNVTYGEEYGSAFIGGALPTPTKTGYIFDGWYLKGKLITADTIVNTAEDHKLTAHWVEQQYTVVFDLNGGNGSVETLIGKIIGNSITLPITDDVSRLGYTPANWKAVNGANVSGTLTGSVTLDATFIERYANGTTITLKAQWTAVEYTVNFTSAHDGNLTSTQVKFKYGATVTHTLETLSDSNYNFAGWTCGNITYAGGNQLTIEQVITLCGSGNSITVTAAWTPIEWTITYNNTKEATNSNPTKYTVETGTITLSGLVKVGYTFKGWYDNSDYNGTAIISISGTGNKVLYAKWMANIYTVTFDYNGGNGTVTTKQVKFDSTYGKDVDGNDVPLPAPAARLGYTFNGWKYNQTTIGDTTTVNVAGDHTLIAQWTANKYNISFVTDNGTTITRLELEFATANDHINLSDSVYTITKRGYTLGGWQIELTDSQLSKVYSGNLSLTQILSENNLLLGKDNTITLKAKWNVITYSITYILNDGTIAADANPATYDIEDTEAKDTTQGGDKWITLSNPTRTGYTFAGWIKVNTYDIVEKIDGIGDLVLNATWTANTYRVSFNSAGGNIVNGKDVTFNATYGELPTPTRAGYTFAGWWLDGTQITASGTVTVAANHELTAQWSAITYTVKFETSFGTAPGNQTVSFVTTETVKDYVNLNFTLNQDGYNLSGWRIQLINSWSDVYTGNLELSTILGNANLLIGEGNIITLRAEWTAIEYTITYNLQYDSEVETATYSLDVPGTLLNPTRTGYTFAGWYSDAACSAGKEITKTTDVVNDKAIGDKTFYAKWTANTYTVTFNTAGGTSVDDKEVTFGLSYGSAFTDGKLPTTTRAGYNFAGWWLNGTQITALDTVTVAANHLLTAQWETVEYTVIFDRNEHGATPDNQTVSFNSDTVKDYVDLSTLSEVGYTFSGWQIKLKDGKLSETYTGRLSLAEILSVATDLTDNTISLKAVWTPATYSITYILNGGSFESNATIKYVYAYGTTVSLPANAENKTVIKKENYTFDGWYLKADFSENSLITSTEGKSGNLTLYAKWSIDTFDFTVSAGESTFKTGLTDKFTVSSDSKTVTFKAEHGENILPILYELQTYLNDVVNKNFLLWGVKSGSSGNEYDQFTDYTVDKESVKNITAIYSATQVSVTLVFLDNRNVVVETINKGTAFDFTKFPPSDIDGYVDYKWIKLGDSDSWDTTKPINESIILREAATAAKPEVTFNSNGGNTIANKTVTFGSAYGELPTPTQAGYIFVGWYLEATWENLVTGDTIVNTAGNHTLYAKYEEQSYTIIYNLNGGRGTVNNLTEQKISDNTIALPTAEVVSRLGYTFDGWKAVKGETYSDKLSNGFFNATFIGGFAVGTTITLEAQWTEITYTVIFDNNGHGTKPDDLTNVKITSESGINLATLSQTGYRFNGWRVRLNGNNVWSANLYSSSVTLAQLLTVSDIFVEEVTVSGTTSYNIYFKADWSAESYSITYNLFGGINGENNPTEYTFGTDVNINNPSLLGFSASGWFIDTACTKPFNYVSTTNGDLVLYAKYWEPIVYTITFATKVEGMSQTSITTNRRFENNVIVNVTVNLPSLIRSAYTFGGWKVVSENNGLTYSGTVNITDIIGHANDNHVIAMEAVWSDAVYTVKYELNGGNFVGGSPQEVFKHGEKVTLPTSTQISKDNYEFIGWFESSEFDGNAITEITAIGKNYMLYAKWERVSKTPEFSADRNSIKDPDSGNEILTWDGIISNGEIKGWTYGDEIKLPEIKDEFKDKYRVVFGVPKVSTASLFSMRRAPARESKTVTDFEWISGLPENAGEGYAFLIIYLFDGADTELPSTENLAEWLKNNNPNGYMLETFPINKRENSATSVDDGKTFEYGTPIQFAVASNENADCEIKYAPAQSRDGWTTNVPVNVGKYQVQVVLSATTNYKEATCYFSFEITPATLTVTANGTATYGDKFDHAKCNIAVEGFKYQDTESVLQGITMLVVDPGERLGAKTYPLDVDLSATEIGNYVLQVVKGTYTVEKRNVTATIEDVVSVYGATLNLDTANVKLSVDGLVYGDGAEALGVTGFETRATESFVVGGVYPINCTGYNSANYNVRFVTGYYVVNRLSVELVINAGGGEYGESIADATIKDVKCTDERVDIAKVKEELLQPGKFSFAYIGATFDDVIYDYSDVAPTNAGIYYVTAICDDDNYSFTNSSIRFTISKKVLPNIVIPSKEYTGGELVPEILAGDYYDYFDYEQVTYVEAASYPITFTLKERYLNNYQWADGASTTVMFTVNKAANGLLNDDLAIKGWTYGSYNAEENSPTSSAAKFGTVIYTYSSGDGKFTTTVPSAGNAGTYWVRAEVVGTNNYSSVISDPVEFSIEKIVLRLPELNIITSGKDKNDVYTGNNLSVLIEGFDPTLMSIPKYDGTLVAGADYSIVARSANSYSITFALRDTVNYRWYEDDISKDGAVRVWTIAKFKVAKPTESKQTYSVSGRMLTYLPVGFDAEIMEIEGNREAFGGTYTATIRLKDTENFEWDDSSTGELQFTWKVVGVNKVFVIIVSTASGLIGVAGIFVGVQCIMHYRKKKRAASAIDEMSAEAEKGGEQPPEQPEENKGDVKGEDK